MFQAGKDVTQFSSITVTDNNDPVHYKQAGENILPSVPVGALASIKTKDTFLLTKSSWMPNNNFISATNSDGESVNPDKISIDGTVNPTVVGNYFIRFSFTDTKLKTLVANMAKVTVVNTLPLESWRSKSRWIQRKSSSFLFSLHHQLPQHQNGLLAR